MKLYVLFGQPKERYEGEFAPEPCLCWSEFEADENPDGFEEACTQARQNKEFQAFVLTTVKVDSDAIRNLMLAPHSLGSAEVEKA